MTNPRTPFANDVPLHNQVYEAVRADILDGLYIGHDDFPGEAELARLFQVSVATSRIVLQRLAADNLIERGRGRRSQAIFKPHHEEVTPLTVNLDLFTFRLLDVGKATAPWAACRAFDIPEGTVTWRCVRLRFVEKRAHSVTFHYQPIGIGGRHSREGIMAKPMPRLLAAAGFPTTRIDCVVGVRRPPTLVANALDLDIWDKVLVTTLTSFSNHDHPTEYAQIFFHPDEHHSLESVTNDALVPNP